MILLNKLEHYLRSSVPGLKWIAGVMAITTLFSCGGSGTTTPDVANIKVDLKSYRFDLDLYNIDPNHAGTGLQKLKEQYPDFLNYYLDTVRAYGLHGNFSDSAKGAMDTFKSELTNKFFVELEDNIKKNYPDKNELDKQLTDGFRFMKYYLPNYTVPRVIYLNMILSNWPTFPVDSTTICVGLDMFLGDQFPHYKPFGVPQYMYSHVRKSYLPVSFFKTVYQTLHPFSQEDRTLLDLMLQRGKEQYFIHKVLPHTSDSVLFGFTQVQLKWCGENEGLAYNFFIHQNLLFSKEGHSVGTYVYDGPFAKDLQDPNDPVKYTPGNIGSWLGYKIVCAWMAEHPKTTLAQLLDLKTDPAKFLEEARYRPK